MESQDFVVEREKSIAKIIINRPERRNAFNIAMWKDLARRIQRLDTETEIRVIVITGADDRAFAAGADITEMVENYPPLEGGKRLHPSKVATTALTRTTKAVIAMINGYAIGGGCELAVACDLRVAADTARMGITSAKLGICISRDDIRRLVALIGPSRAKEMLFTGRLLTAQDALSAGLVDHVVPGERLESFTMALAGEIAQNAPLSILGAKRIINGLMGMADTDAGTDDHFYPAKCFESQDFREGVQAFLNKRKPSFLGR